MVKSTQTMSCAQCCFYTEVGKSGPPRPTQQSRHGSVAESCTCLRLYTGPGNDKCERMLLGSPWELLPDMHAPRATFTPAIWQGAVYLCGGHFSPTIESFDGVTMRLLDISGTGSTMTCIKRNTLLIFTNDCLTMLEGALSPVARVSKKAVSVYPCTPAVL